MGDIYFKVFTLNSTKSHNFCKICRINMVAQYDQLHTVTYNSTKFEHNLSSEFQGVWPTTCPNSVQCTYSTNSHYSCKFAESKMAAQHGQLHIVNNNHTTLKKSIEQFPRSCIHKVFL